MEQQHSCTTFIWLDTCHSRRIVLLIHPATLIDLFSQLLPRTKTLLRNNVFLGFPTKNMNSECLGFCQSVLPQDKLWKGLCNLLPTITMLSSGWWFSCVVGQSWRENKFHFKTIQGRQGTTPFPIRRTSALDDNFLLGVLSDADPVEALSASTRLRRQRNCAR